MEVDVQGVVKPGFEPIAEALSQSQLGEGGAAFSAYVDGVMVADLWAGDSREGESWRSDTMATAMSATKGLTAAVMMMLHDRGVVDVDAPVIEYWPEYAQKGKGQTLVRHVLTHTCGVVGLTDPGSILDWSGRGWADYDAIADALAATAPAWEPGTRIGYHGVTYGWLCQEIVRRATGDTIGAFFCREVATPLGLSAFIGTPAHQQDRIATVAPMEYSLDTPERTAIFEAARALITDPTTPLGQSNIAMRGGSILGNVDFLNLPHVRSAEIPGVNASVDARSLARLYAALANGGTLDGVALADEATVRLFGTPAASGPSAMSAFSSPDESPMRYALGFEGDFGETPQPWRFGPSPRAFGHLGLGGQIGFADPERRVSVGFVRNHFADWDVSTRLVDTLYHCLHASEGRRETTGRERADAIAVEEPCR